MHAHFVLTNSKILNDFFIIDSVSWSFFYFIPLYQSSFNKIWSRRFLFRSFGDYSVHGLLSQLIISHFIPIKSKNWIIYLTSIYFLNQFFVRWILWDLYNNFGKYHFKLKQVSKYSSDKKLIKEIDRFFFRIFSGYLVHGLLSQLIISHFIPIKSKNWIIYLTSIYFLNQFFVRWILWDLYNNFGKYHFKLKQR